MNKGPETRFIQQVNRYLSLDVHREKIHNPYRGGTPDFYYEAKPEMMWVEYKFLTKVPPTVDCTDTDRMLSALQQLWLERAHKNGRQTAVIVGWEKGGVIFEGLDWKQSIERDDFESRTKSKKEIAAWLRSRVCKKRKAS